MRYWCRPARQGIYSPAAGTGYRAISVDFYEEGKKGISVSK